MASEGCAQNEPFALQVTDQLMEPEFPKGCVIIVEPGGVLENGCFVVALTEKGYVFRRLLVDESGWQLVALQDNVAAIAVDDRQMIRGRVIQRAGKRRKDRKFYD